MHTESKNLIGSRDVKFLKDIENSGNDDVFDKSTQNRRDFPLINNIRRAASLNGVDIGNPRKSNVYEARKCCRNYCGSI